MSHDARLTIIGKHKGVDYESITVTNASAIGFTSSKISTAPRPKRAFCTSETGSMRYRYDGTDPETTEGHLLLPTDTLIVEGIQNMENFKVIATSATSGKIKVTYEF